MTEEAAISQDDELERALATPDGEVLTSQDADAAAFTGAVPAAHSADPVSAALPALPAQSAARKAPAASAPATAIPPPPAASLHRVTFFTEFVRVLRTRPDWLYGMLTSWVLGLGTYAFLLVFTKPDLANPMNALVIPVILTAVADGSLTNQLAAEPRWVAGLLRAGTDPGRILLARNVVLALWELCFVGIVVGITVALGDGSAWVGPALPQLAMLPIASIAIGNLASVLVPCPFMRMSKRFQAVNTWARWCIYIAIPWALSSVALAMWTLPVYLEGRWEPRVVTHVVGLKHYAATVQNATHAYFMIWVVVIPLWHLTVWLFSLKLAQSFARVRRHGLLRLMDRHVQLTTRLPDLSLAAAARQLPTRIREIPNDLRSELSLLGSEILEATTTMTRL